MNKNGQKLTKRQVQAIPAILAAKSITDGCREARVSRTQFYTWLEQPDFRAEYERQRSALIDVALDALKASTGEAVEVLKALLKSRNDNVKLRASTAILEHVGRFMEIEDIARRLDALEGSLRR
jgi:hypothetical protein